MFIHQTVRRNRSEFKIKVDSINASSYLTSAYNDVLKKVANKEIIPKINDIVRDYFPDFKIESIKSSSSFSLSVKSESINTISSIISSSLNEIEEGLFEGLVKVLWNIGAGTTAIVDTILINTGIGLINVFRKKPIDTIDIGDAVDAVTFSFRDKKTGLSSSRRNDVKDNFDKNKSTFEVRVCSDLKSKLKSDSSLINQINIKGQDDIKKYIKEQIQNARIMLN